VFVNALTERGFNAFKDEAGNAVAVAGNGDREILLVGHIDTVPGDLPVTVTGDGWLTGRGSVDAKGPLTAFACAAEKFLTDDRVRVVVVGACDEEGVSHGARHLIPRYQPEALVIGEPSGGNGVTIGYKGILRLTWTLTADLEHGGTPNPSVPDKGVQFWASVQQYLARHHADKLFNALTGKLTRFHTDLLPDGRHHARLEGSIRLPPDCDVTALQEHLTAHAEGGDVDVQEVLPAVLGDKNSLLARAFIASLREHGHRPRYVRKTGTSDMNVLAPAWGCPVIAYGPGDSTLDHTPRERLSLREYRESIRVLESGLERLAAHAP
jgi:[amino group carrier protein]-lysine/ornithine hydrolase